MGKKEVSEFLSYSSNKKKKLRFKYKRQLKSFLISFLALALETLFLLMIALLLIIFLITKGLSPTARDLFVRSVKETSAIGFLADIYLSEEEIFNYQKYLYQIILLKYYFPQIFPTLNHYH